ncbi:MAG: hypothetical protein E6K91_03695 [Thaumarchaeota archaeon]|nr:MAG: hypothetical protein E6K91_03695 [Nitrososphaerota archaeon]
MGGRTGKMTNYMVLLFTMAIFAAGLGSTFAGSAYADDQGGRYSHSHETATWNHGLVCGDHKCAPGETPQNPPAVVPVKGIK